MLARNTTVDRSLRRRGNRRSWKSRKIAGFREHQHIGFLIGEDVLPEFDAERGEALVDFREPRLGCVQQAAARLKKTPATQSKSEPLRSSAAIVFSKAGGSGLFAMAAASFGSRFVSYYISIWGSFRL
jgi:hypothetical protein